MSTKFIDIGNIKLLKTQIDNLRSWLGTNDNGYVSYSNCDTSGGCS